MCNLFLNTITHLHRKPSEVKCVSLAPEDDSKPTGHCPHTLQPSLAWPNKQNAALAPLHCVPGLESCEGVGTTISGGAFGLGALHGLGIVGHRHGIQSKDLLGSQLGCWCSTRKGRLS
jgi:hypothetical protein